MVAEIELVTLLELETWLELEILLELAIELDIWLELDRLLELITLELLERRLLKLLLEKDPGTEELLKIGGKLLELTEEDGNQSEWELTNVEDEETAP